MATGADIEKLIAKTTAGLTKVSISPSGVEKGESAVYDPTGHKGSRYYTDIVDDLIKKGKKSQAKKYEKFRDAPVIDAEERYGGETIDVVKAVDHIKSLTAELYKTKKQLTTGGYRAADPKTPKSSEDVLENFANYLEKIETDRGAKTNDEVAQEKAAFIKAVEDTLVEERLLKIEQDTLNAIVSHDEDPTQLNISESSKQRLEEISHPYETATGRREYGVLAGLLLPETVSGKKELTKKQFRRARLIDLRTQPLTNADKSYIEAAKRDIFKEQQENSERLGNLFREGTILEPEQQRKSRDIEFKEGDRLNYAKAVGSELIESAKDNLMSGVQHSFDLFRYATRGVLSSSKAKDSAAWKKYIELRNKNLQSRVHALHPDKSNAFYDELMAISQNYAANGLMSNFEFNDVWQLLEKYDKEISAEHAARIAKLNENIIAASKDLMSKEQDHLKKEDEMWKYRVIQTLLIFSPFAPFSMISPFIGWIEDAMRVGGGLADFLSSITAAGNIPVLGDITDFDFIGGTLRGMGAKVPRMSVHDGIEFLTHNGPLGGILNVGDAILQSDIVQGIGKALLPSMNDVLGQLALAFGVSIYRLPIELEHHQQGNKIVKDAEKTLVADLMAKFDMEVKSGSVATKDGKKIDTKGRDAFIKEFIQKRLTLREKGFMASEAMDFLREPSNRSLRKIIWNDKNFLDMISDRTKYPDENELGREIYKNPNLLDKILLVKAVSREVVEQNRTLTGKAWIDAVKKRVKDLEDPKNLGDRNDMITKAKGVLERDYYCDIAKASGMIVEKHIEDDKDGTSKRIEQVKGLKIAIANSQFEEMIVNDAQKMSVKKPIPPAPTTTTVPTTPSMPTPPTPTAPSAAASPLPPGPPSSLPKVPSAPPRPESPPLPPPPSPPPSPSSSRSSSRSSSPDPSDSSSMEDDDSSSVSSSSLSSISSLSDPSDSSSMEDDDSSSVSSFSTSPWPDLDDFRKKDGGSPSPSLPSSPSSSVPSSPLSSRPSSPDPSDSSSMEDDDSSSVSSSPSSSAPSSPSSSRSSSPESSDLSSVSSSPSSSAPSSPSSSRSSSPDPHSGIGIISRHTPKIETSTVHDIPPKKPVDITGSEHDDKENEIGEKKENPLPSAIDSKKKDAARNKPRSKSLPNIESNLANRPPKNDAVENIPKQDSVPPKPAEDLENRPAATFTDEEDTLTQEKDEEDTKEKEIPPSTTQPPAAPNYAQPTAASDPVQPAAAPDPVQPAAAPGPVVNGDEGDIVTQEENKKLVDLTGSEHDDEDNEIGKKEESRPSSPIDPSDQKNDVANARPRRNSLPNLQSAVENRPPNSVRPRSNSVTNLRGEIHKHEDPIEKILHSTPVFGGNRGLGDG